MLAPPINPWLVSRDDVGMSKAARKKNDVVIAKESNTLDKSKNKLRKQARKREEEKEKARADAELEISMDDTLTPGAAASVGLPTEQKPSQASKAKAAATSGAQTAAEDSDANSEVDEQEKALAQKGKKNGVKAFQQRDLVARAFAGDNVVRVCFLLPILARITYCRCRISRMPSNEKCKPMHQKKWIQHFLAG